MSRPRKPTHLLELNGAFRKNPSRARPNEPDGNGEFPSNPPPHLNAAQAVCWREIAAACPTGVLTGSDVLVVEITAVLLEQFRRMGAAMQNSKIARLAVLFNKLGMDPAGRAGLTVHKPYENPYDRF